LLRRLAQCWPGPQDIESSEVSRDAYRAKAMAIIPTTTPSQ